MATIRRVILAIATIGVSVAVATPSIGATNIRSIPWAALGNVRPILVQPAGWGSTIAAQPRSATFGWCSQTGVEIASGSGKPTLVSDSAVGQMLRNSHLGLSRSPGSPRDVVTCEDIALDPKYPKTVYAAFQASRGGLIPPSYAVALVTTNMGRSWRFVPPPSGDSLTDFAGFIERLGGVQMLYSSNYFFPPKAGHFSTFVAATSPTGGRTWTDVNLNCPAGEPCVLFGPQAPQGACGMSEWRQSVLVGTSNENDANDVWQPAGSVSTVSQCGDQQLVATTSRDEFLIDRSRPSALVFTHDGMHWTTVLLPKVKGVSIGGTFAPFGQMMTLAANGDLIAILGSPLATAERIEILKPGTHEWCGANAALPATTKKDPVLAIQSSASRLVVAFLTPIETAGAKKASALTFRLSALRCRT